MCCFAATPHPSAALTPSPMGKARGAAAPVQGCGGVMHGGKAGRALSERPYRYDGKCCGFAGRQLEFVMFACREDGRLGGFAVGWGGMGGCAAHLISQKSDRFLTASPQGEALGAEVDGEVTIPQSFPLYKQRKIQLPLHKGALGAEEDGGAVEEREAWVRRKTVGCL